MARRGEGPPVWRDARGHCNEKVTRLETMHGGTVVGEIAFYTRGMQTATVQADRPTTVYRLSRASLQRMTAQAPQVAAGLHELVARLMAGRVAHLVRVVRTLQE